METSNQFSVTYFIKKFEAIPEERWHVRAFSNMDGTKLCALGHCRWHKQIGGSDEGNELIAALRSIGKPDSINDGIIGAYLQPTPKQRILAALYDIKANQQPEPVKEIEPVKERTVYVTVDQAVRKLQKEMSEN